MVVYIPAQLPQCRSTIWRITAFFAVKNPVFRVEPAIVHKSTQNGSTHKSRKKQMRKEVNGRNQIVSVATLIRVSRLQGD